MGCIYRSLMGRFSDRYQMGTPRPFIFTGAFLMAISFLSIDGSENLSEIGIFHGYQHKYFVFYIIHNLFSAL